jgi:drug/metabolite transporter (DMT)-like permease
MGCLNGGIRRLLLLAFIWGWSFLFIKVSVEGMSPPTVAFARVTLGALVLIAVLKVQRRSLPRGREIWTRFAITAVFANVIPFTLLAWGEERITSALASVLNASTPLFTALIAALYLKDRLTRLQSVGLVLGFAGVAVAAGVGAGDLGRSSAVGASAAVLAGFFYGIAFAYMRRHLITLEPTVAATGQLLMASLLSLPFAAVTTASSGLHLTTPRVLAICALGAIGTGIAYILNYRIIADVGATRAAVVTYIVPIVAVTVGVVVLDEPFEWRLVLGGLIIVGGLALLRERRMLRVPVPNSAAVVLLVLLVVVPFTACSSSTKSACSPAVKEALDPDFRHVLPTGGPEPTYNTDPPTSGPHTPGALPKGVLTEPISRPVQVGALEAGVVLIQVRDVSDNEMNEMRALVTDNVVIVPNSSLPERIVATAWLSKQTCTAVDAAALRGFIRTHAGKGPGTDG